MQLIAQCSHGDSRRNSTGGDSDGKLYTFLWIQIFNYVDVKVISSFFRLSQSLHALLYHRKTLFIYIIPLYNRKSLFAYSFLHHYWRRWLLYTFPRHRGKTWAKCKCHHQRPRVITDAIEGYSRNLLLIFLPDYARRSMISGTAFVKKKKKL